jgi:cell division septal protein FtsQ
MREEVVGGRGARRVAASREFTQRPARRESAAALGADRSPLRALAGYLPAAFKYVLVLAALIAIVIGYRAAASASLFQVRTVDVNGTSRTSADEIATLTRRAVSRTGVWRANLLTLSAELERLPGVRRAIVTRVLPDGLRVRIIERVPAAVVRTAAGHFVWVDDEGIALGEMKATDRMPNFFIRGWNEEEGEEVRKENAERIQKYLELAHQWDANGLSERVSEVNLLDIKDVRAQLAGNDSQIEVRLGAQEFGERLKKAINVLDAEKQNPRAALINYIDLTQGKWAVIGLSTGGKLSPDRSNSVPSSQPAPSPKPVQPATNTRAAASDKNLKNANKSKPSNDNNRKPGSDKSANKNSSKNANSNAARPRQ